MNETIIISSCEFNGKTLRVEKMGDTFQVVVDEVVKHPNCTAEDVIRVMSHYLNGSKR